MPSPHFRVHSPAGAPPRVRGGQWRLRSLAGVLIGLGLLAAACGDSSGGSVPATTGAALTTTSAAISSTTPPSTVASTTEATAGSSTTASTTTVPPTTEATTTTASTTTTTAATTTTIDVNALAEGSGCTPGSSTLPDGHWFGLVDSVDGTSVTFDLACWFTGDPAAVAAAQDGEESPPPNDYYIRNVNPMLRTIPVASLAEVAWMPNPGDPSTVEVIGFPEWVTNRLSRSYQPPVWLNIEGGEIISIEEQYIP